MQCSWCSPFSDYPMTPLSHCWYALRIGLTLVCLCTRPGAFFGTEKKIWSPNAVDVTTHTPHIGGEITNGHGHVSANLAGQLPHP
jgi:hypothetical protein